MQHDTEHHGHSRSPRYSVSPPPGDGALEDAVGGLIRGGGVALGWPPAQQGSGDWRQQAAAPPAHRRTNSLHTLASDDFAKMLQFEGDADANLDGLASFFEGAEGDELLDAEFADLLSPRATGSGSGAKQGAGDGGAATDPQAVAEAARSVLAALESPRQGGAGGTPLPGGRPPALEVPAPPGGVALQESPKMESMVDLLHGPLEGEPCLAARSPRPAVAMAAPAGTPPPMRQAYQVVSPAQALFLDPRTGQVLSPAAAPQGSPWLGGPAGLQAVHAGQVVSIGGRPVQLLGAGPQAVQYIAVQGPHGVHALALPPGMQLVQGMPQGGAASPGGRGRASAKRKRGPPTASMESTVERSARLAQGYTYDPATGRMLRHGPALLAAARHDRDVPVIGALFDACAAQPFSLDPAPHGYAVAVQQQQQQQQQFVQGGPAVGQVGRDSAGGSYQQQYMAVQAGLVAQAGQDMAAPSPLMQQMHARQAVMRLQAPPVDSPGSRRASHGYITHQVTRELQSSAPPAPDGGGPLMEQQDPGGLVLRGVSRDRWNLFWDAYVEPPPPPPGAGQGALSAVLAGFKQEAIYLGKFPTQQQAGRAHDIAALKLHGPAAQTNYPAEVYSRALPALAQHSGQEVVSALRKDSQLALQRTSKHKGVRRVGPGMYEARVDRDPSNQASPASEQHHYSSG